LYYCQCPRFELLPLGGSIYVLAVFISTFKRCGSALGYSKH
jgi:hypothetical protein